MDKIWTYEEAFSRHSGLLSGEEQRVLRRSRVAIAGLGGVGGVHLITLARLGIGSFHIADPDSYELANFNRQYGARLSTLGARKVAVMAEDAHEINPQLDLRLFPGGVNRSNMDAFLDGVDVLVDGIDFFEIDARRALFRRARERGIWVVTGGPHAFGTGWLVFSPTGMSFERYFDFHDGMDELDKIAAFSVGLVPQPLHLKYVDLKAYFNGGSRRGASAGLACQLASGVVAAETLKILLGKPGIRPAPWYFQFDAFRQELAKGYLLGGNRHPWQRLKRWWLRKRMESGRGGSHEQRRESGNAVAAAKAAL